MALLFSETLTGVFTSFVAGQAQGLTVSALGKVSLVPGRLEISTAPDGSPALMSQITPSDTPTATGIRSEINYSPEANAERWYVWEVFHANGFSPLETITFMQIHDSPDGGEGVVKYPNFEFFSQGGYVFCAVPIDAPNEVSSSSRFPPQVRVPLITGKWVQCAVHSNWATDSTGFLEAYYNGSLVSKEWFRACGYSDAVGPYWKLGLYDFTHGGLSTTYTAWYRNASLYSTGHSASSIFGAQPLPPSGRTLGP